ncbi:MAG: RluA family pseudouridine synthase [Verrucomicrobiales bacterium]
MIVPATAAGQRLDVFLASAHPELSRSRLQSLIKDGHIRLNAQTCKPRTALNEGDEILIELPAEKPATPQPEKLPLDILYEDDSLLVLNKAPGMVVHPADGSPDGTLVNALLHHTDGRLAFADDPENLRPGIVHRLDKDTSGCLVVAKTKAAHHHLVAQFAERQTAKLYLAVAQATPKEAHQTVFNNIGRHPVHRQRMDVVNPGSGKPAITDFHLLHPAADGTALLLCALHTGRTHQIRVHTRYLGHPLMGDPIYAKPARQPGPPTRLMLHAWRLGLSHPETGQWLQSEAPIPSEFHPWSEPAAASLSHIRELPPKDYDALNEL